MNARMAIRTTPVPASASVTGRLMTIGEESRRRATCVLGTTAAAEFVGAEAALVGPVVIGIVPAVAGETHGIVPESSTVPLVFLYEKLA